MSEASKDYLGRFSQYITLSECMKIIGPFTVQEQRKSTGRQDPVQTSSVQVLYGVSIGILRNDDCESGIFLSQILWLKNWIQKTIRKVEGLPERGILLECRTISYYIQIKYRSFGK
jgi:hypothetical protein